MARINCKCCGCPNEVEQGKFVVVCEACGTEQAVPQIDSEKKMNLFNRANAARLKCDFDKALTNYESILIEYPNDAEAHWGICLCRYGIEYVDDIKTKKKIPTCHRTIYQSIFDDFDYKEAIENADVIARKIYQDEAETIERIQKSIIAISQQEQPYDIFICYKETDENGTRTRDSFVAEDIYNELVEKDYKVFFSRITLESKLGQQYEPIIFAALQSAKVMLVIGSKKEYFESAWVKNEWSRYLSFMAENKTSKYMIPCYRDMEAYDMPDEFLSLQSQNLDKLGAKQDLIRAIDKIFGKDKKPSETASSYVVDTSGNANLLKRSLLLIEDGEYDKADELLENVLNNDPECAEAYVYKILISKKLHTPDDLGNLSETLDEDKNYQKAVRFASDEYLQVVEGYNQKIISNLNEKNKEKIYNNANAEKRSGYFEEALALFNKILEYSDSKILAKECEEKIKEKTYKYALNLKNLKKYDEAIAEFNKVIYYKNAQQEIQDCKSLKENAPKEEVYVKYKSLAIKASSIEELDEKEFKNSIFQLKSISQYKDTAEFIKNQELIFENNKVEKERIQEENKLKEQQLQEEKRKKALLKKQKIIKFTKIFAPIIVVLIVLLILTFTLFIPMGRYNQAMGLLEQGKLNEAEEILKSINFSNSKAEVKMVEATKFFEDCMINEESMNYEKGIDIIYNLGGTVNVTYDSDGGTAKNTSDVIKLSSYIDNRAEKEGYRFEGWKLSTYKVDYSKISADIKLVARYTINEYILIIDMNGCDGKCSIDGISRTLNTGKNKLGYNVSQTIELYDPEKPGYTFSGWTGTDLEKPTKAFSFKNKCGGRTYTANWLPNEYTVTFDVDGGEPLENNIQTIKYDDEYQLPVPTKKGYEFLGWYNGDQLVENGIWQSQTDMKLTAKWAIQKYNITYKLDGGTNAEKNPSTYTYNDETITLLEPSKTGYEFLGWTTSDISKPNKSISIEKNSTGNKEFVANWKPKDYIITYNANGGKISGANMMVVTYGENYSLVTPSKYGYRFAGWYYGSYLIENGKWTFDKNITLSAKWELVTYKIQYELNGGTNSKENPATYTYETETITLANPAKIGYTFLGWSIPGSDVCTMGIKIEKNSTQDRVFTAHWKANEYNITFDKNGGDEDVPNAVYTYDSAYVLPTPKRTGYTFVQWNYNGSKLESSVWNIASDVTLVAQWKAKTNIMYKVNHYQENLDDDEYTLFDSSTLYGTSDSSVTPETKTYEGFKTPERQTTTINPDGSLVINYYYSRNRYTITFISNGGTKIDNLIKKYQSEFDKNIEPTKTNRTFDGWYNDEKFKTKFDYLIPLNDITLYAKWKEEVSPSELTYEVSNNSITISGSSFSGELFVLPDYIGGRVVEKIESSAFSGKGWRKIVLPNTVASIGKYAFKDMTSLVELTVPYVSIIGEWFNSVMSGYTGPSGMYQTTSYISGSSNYTSTYYYYVPTTLTTITVTNSDSIPASAFSNMQKLKTVTVPATITSIGAKAFYNCKNLSTINSTTPGVINIPEGVHVIEASTFNGCSTIAEVTMSDNITSIGGSAFYNCSNIVKFNSNEAYKMVVPSKCESIGSNSFYNLSQITKLTIGDKCTSIGDCAFANMTSLVELTVPYVSIIGKWFNSVMSGYTGPSGMYQTISYISGSGNYTNTYYYYVPTTLTTIIVTNSDSIPASAFSNMQKLKTVTVPATITSIGAEAFYNCKNLSTINSTTPGVINIPEGVKKIETSTFNGCSTIAEVTMSDNITSIGSSAFYNCSNIVKFNSNEAYKMVVPSKCESIGQSSFSGVSNMKKLTVGNKCTSIGNYAFANMTSLVELTVPSITTTYGIGEWFNQSTSSTAPSGMYNTTSYKYNNSYNYYCFVPTTLTTINVTNTSSIPAKAFYGMSKLTSVTIPTTVTTIGSSAFYNCSKLSTLNSTTPGLVNVPTGVVEIESSAFYGCSTIAEITMNDNITTIGSSAFYNCSNIVRFNSNEAYKMVVPSKCESIGQSSFSGVSKIKKLIVGNKCTSIGSYAFSNITSLVELTVPFIPFSYGVGMWFNQSTSNTAPSGMYNTTNSSNSCYYYVPTTLTTINVTNTDSIPAKAFYGMVKLTSVTIPTTVTTIGESAFYNCSKLSTLNSTIPGLISIPSGVKEIEKYTFYGCSAIAEVTMSDEITAIGDYAFYNCTNIVKFNSEEAYKLVVPSKCETLGVQCFSGVSSITNLVMSTTVTKISSAPFARMKDLTLVDIPFIPGSYTFGYLFGTASYTGGTATAQGSTYYIPTALRTVYLRNDSELPSKAFYNCNKLTDIYILDYCTSQTDTFTNCTATIHSTLEYDVNAVWDGVHVATSYHSGTGEINSPYIIDNPTEFAYFVSQVNAGNDYSNKYISITSNINMNGQTIDTIGFFNGNLNGNGHVLSNYSISNKANNVGLFEHTGPKSRISNLGLKVTSFAVTNDTNILRYNIGGFVGYNEGIIENCYTVDGKITFSTTNDIYVGGFVGYNSGTIENCYSTSTVSCTSSISYVYAGGFVGYNEGSIKKSFATGNVTSKGLTIAYSYVGGFAGYSTNENITDCMRLKTQSITQYTTVGDSTNTIGEGLTLVEIIDNLKQIWHLSTWNFDYSYPNLIAQH